MNNSLHEPEFIGDIKNAIGYFVVLGFLTCGTLFIFGGMFAPFFVGYWSRMADGLARDAAKKGHYTYEEMKPISNWFVGIGVAIWSLIAWAIFVFAIYPKMY